ncbi:hypothetical protein P5G61_00480 [Paenibacillus sp. F6_3S_P_1C]|uniref:Uncharacterized protein n=1 Tax=Paenibacillus vandeheii TaxID=3035917 RepID=A0ABT8J4Y2_9BACL|nr:hypothetical protein [Paenibacillus vandeheii]MDN4599686.1 hypothetical protein [Paenibacillus vandeheii]
MNKGLHRGLKVLGGLMLATGLVLLTGTAYEAYQSTQDMKAYSPSGTYDEMSGSNMHLYAAGKDGVTMAFASDRGAPNPYMGFSSLYQPLKPHVKLAMHDHFGSGYSDVTDRPRGLETVTEEIHPLLRVSGQVAAEFLKIAHSFNE